MSIIAFFEIALRLKKSPATEFENYQRYLSININSNAQPSNTPVDSEGENKFGKRMISIGIIATGLIIGGLGAIADNGKGYVLGMAAILLLIGYKILPKTVKIK